MKYKCNEKREELVNASKKLAHLGYVASKGGNLSLRIEDGFLITPKGHSKRDITKRNIVVMDLQGRVLSAAKSILPSSEASTHLRILKKRPDIKGIIHAHPPILTGFSFTDLDILSRPIHPEMIIEIGSVASTPYTEPSSEKLADSLEPVLMKTNTFLLKNHGIVICSLIGVNHALELLEMLESMAYAILVGLRVGKINEIPKEEIDKLDEIMRERNLPIPGAPGVIKHLRDFFF